MTRPTPDLDELERLRAALRDSQVPEDYLRVTVAFDPLCRVLDALPALIASARREQGMREVLTKEADDHADRVSYWRNEAGRLREALEPFAREAAGWSPGGNAGYQFDDDTRLYDVVALTVGDLRRARAAVADSGCGEG